MGLRICISNRFPSDAAAPAGCLGDREAAGGGGWPSPRDPHRVRAHLPAAGSVAEGAFLFGGLA